eukprot:TRINITY_DN12824_c0_g1_i1.p1 TRINITY_DN12824_c0_g1~~TRINITY_DN12824_c0_g1_i1.p1  ORF type:complete len:508 (+),score=124.71 TRINITY_DN12824_c0_g1_i1:82-1605(+)
MTLSHLKKKKKGIMSFKKNLKKVKILKDKKGQKKKVIDVVDDDVRDKKTFLFDRVSAYFENDDVLLKYNMNRLIGLFLSVKRVEDLFVEEEFHDNKCFLNGCALRVTNCIRRMITNDLDYVRKGIGDFYASWEFAKNNYIEPLYDLDGYGDESSTDIPKFLDYFSHQVDNNYGNLEKLESIKLKRTLNQLASNLSLLDKKNLPKIFTSDIMELIVEVTDLISPIKDILIELQTTLSSHSVHCNDTMNTYKLETFETTLFLAHQYSMNHKDDFTHVHDFFMSDEIPELPISVLYINEYSEQEILIETESVYESVKSCYRIYQDNLKRLKNLIPDELPIKLPNFSTFDGLPPIVASNLDDFLLTLNTYVQYISRTQSLGRGWSALLQAIFEFMETSKEIEEPEEGSPWVKNKKVNYPRSSNPLLGANRGRSFPTLPVMSPEEKPVIILSKSAPIHTDRDIEDTTEKPGRNTEARLSFSLENPFEEDTTELAEEEIQNVLSEILSDLITE